MLEKLCRINNLVNYCGNMQTNDMNILTNLGKSDAAWKKWVNIEGEQQESAEQYVLKTLRKIVQQHVQS